MDLGKIVFVFFRVLPDSTIAELRTDISSQLEHEKMPPKFAYVKGIGRHFTQVRIVNRRSADLGMFQSSGSGLNHNAIKLNCFCFSLKYLQ
jgi:hypothetical protein